MPAQNHDHERCRKHGVILTCYVNGRKRFRAVSFQEAGPPAPLDADAPRRAGSLAPRPRFDGVPSRRRR